MQQQFEKRNRMEAKLIKTEEDYDAALTRIDALFDAVPGSKDFDEVELLMALVAMYEEKHFKIDAPDPIEAIKFRMEQMNMKRTDLAPFIGSRARVSEILNKQRNLTLAMIKKLHKDFGVPAESLLA